MEENENNEVHEERKIKIEFPHMQGYVPQSIEEVVEESPLISEIQRIEDEMAKHEKGTNDEEEVAKAPVEEIKEEVDDTPEVAPQEEIVEEKQEEKTEEVKVEEKDDEQKEEVKEEETKEDNKVENTEVEEESQDEVEEPKEETQESKEEEKVDFYYNPDLRTLKDIENYLLSK